MYKTGSGGTPYGAESHLGYVETDPSGRYGRFKEILGKGAMKTVYKAFDEVLGLEVAWNQVKLNDVFRMPDQLQRLYSEVQLLNNLNHHSIMRFYTNWIDTDLRTFNFITEMFTSGTLREYRQKYRGVNIRAVKDWARQILEGLAYLHGHDPPVIHRDLKCDNIFVNGHFGQVKIGDLGLAATLRGCHNAHSVIGTPEFMAPELYEEDYNELVDIYSFGMCVLEMLTSEYPYNECSNPAQIYKKVTSGKLPKAFYQIEDSEARRFIGRCLEKASSRPSAKELLTDPFLAMVEDERMSMAIQGRPHHSPPLDEETTKDALPLLTKPARTTDMTITGTMNPDDNTIYLKVQISDKDGEARNIHFPFDILRDTALDVAVEMVKELEITDWEPFEIAESIEEEIANLVPTWKQWDLIRDDQHSFNYDEEDGEDKDDDDRTHHPFYCTSSASASHASLQGVFPFNEMGSRKLDGLVSSSLNLALPLPQGNFFIDDDASSQSSFNPDKFCDINYCSNNESENHPSWKERERCNTGKACNCTRFCPQTQTEWEQASASPKSCHKNHDSGRQQKLKKVRSVVEVRSQLLQRLFKTVAAIENIGYHEIPGEYSTRLWMTGGQCGKSPKRKQGCAW